jgi:Na+-translocating ferredoxin:NAD+ oxidoreductase RnfD subunit
MENISTPTKYNPIPALRRFAMAITVLNIAGHFFLGFEQSFAYPLVAIATTYSLEIMFEFLFCYFNGKKPRYSGGLKNMVDFLLPAHISGMATSMLLFANSSLYPIVFASAVAISSKIIFRVNVDGRSRHFLNPSNTGIAVTLILFSWVGISPPYMFTENLYGIADWILPCILIIVGSMLNTVFTGRITLIVAWVFGFFLQAYIRSVFFDVSFVAGLLPLTGVAFLLFTFYMISDPATTPQSKSGQVIFAFSTAFVYGLLMVFHVVFGLFFALLITCSLRGIYIFVMSSIIAGQKYPALSETAVIPNGYVYEK